MSDNDEHLEQDQSIVHPLSEDNTPPFSPPTDAVRQDAGQLDSTHQATDSATDIDSQQLYDEGLAGAAEASEPNAGNTVVDYDPDKAQD